MKVTEGAAFLAHLPARGDALAVELAHAHGGLAQGGMQSCMVARSAPKRAPQCVSWPGCGLSGVWQWWLRRLGAYEATQAAR